MPERPGKSQGLFDIVNKYVNTMASLVNSHKWYAYDVQY